MAQWLRLHSPVEGGAVDAGIGSIHGQGARIPHALWQKKQNVKGKQYCNEFNKDFKNGPHFKKRIETCLLKVHAPASEPSCLSKDASNLTDWVIFNICAEQSQAFQYYKPFFPQKEKRPTFLAVFFVDISFGVIFGLVSKVLKWRPSPSGKNLKN